MIAQIVSDCLSSKVNKWKFPNGCQTIGRFYFRIRARSSGSLFLAACIGIFDVKYRMGLIIVSVVAGTLGFDTSPTYWLGLVTLRDESAALAKGRQIACLDPSSLACLTCCI